MIHDANGVYCDNGIVGVDLNVNAPIFFKEISACGPSLLSILCVKMFTYVKL